MPLVFPHSSDHFNSLPDITQSGNVFNEVCTPEVSIGICQIFLKHQVQRIFGLALLHQHFQLQRNEKMVNVGNVALPIIDSPSNLSVAASRWAISGDKVIPYEFTAGAEHIDMDKYVAFFSELSDALHSNGLADNLGLCSAESITEMASGPTTEFTSGRVNITLPFDPDPLGGNNVDAAWNISKGINSSRKIPDGEWLTILRLRDSGIRSVQE